MDDREKLKQLVEDSYARGDATGWFEQLYAGASGKAEQIPWADLKPNPNLVDWLDREKPSPGRALVVGCGLGDDAEELARRGFTVTAFDIAPSAIAWAQKRFPTSKVDYRVGDATAPEANWVSAFDLVFESYTLQAIPPDLRKRAIPAIAGTVKPGGKLLVICRGREENDAFTPPPWPLTKAELDAIAEQPEMSCSSFEDFLDPHEEEMIRRFRAVYVRK